MEQVLIVLCSLPQTDGIWQSHPGVCMSTVVKEMIDIAAAGVMGSSFPHFRKICLLPFGMLHLSLCKIHHLLIAQ